MEMKETHTEKNGTAPVPSGPERPEGNRKARVTPRRAHAAPAKAKAALRPPSTKKAPKGAKKAGSPRDGSKAAKIIDLLKRLNGATLAEIMKATYWQPHSVRGFISGSLGKKMGLTIVSARRESGERVYSISR
jgi:hypothetical protein